MKLFLCSTLLGATQANFFRHVSKSHRVPHFLGAGKNHATNKFHAVFQIVHDTDLASTEVEYFDCGTNDANTCMSGTPIHTLADLSATTVNNDAAVTNVKDTTNGVYDLEYTPTQGYNHIITKLELNSHTILEESYLCAAGHVPKSSGAGCDPCTAGKYAERGALSCSDCAAGKDSSAGATKAGDCAVCAVGKVSAGGVACSGCGLGEKPKSDKSACENCPNGKYQDSAGQSDTCKSCPVGKANPGGAAAADYDSQTDCDDCAAGKYADSTGLASCKNCAAGSETQASSAFVTSAAEDCVTCAQGKADTDSDSSTTCYSCDATLQEYQSSTGQTLCNTCGTNTFTCGDNTVSSCASNCGSSGGGGGSVTCANAWEYIATGGNGYLSCATCAAGKDQTSPTGSSCDDCDAGKSRANGAQAACASCADGKYSQAGATQCTDCDDGQEDTGTDGNKATACRDCPIGKYDDDLIASTACKVCGRGKYQNAVKKTSCTDCAAGSHNDGAGGSNTDTAGDMDDPTDCVSCGAGTFSAAGAATCTDCDVGKYSTTTGATASSTCLDCNAGPNSGLTTATAGSGKQSDCVFAVTMYGYVKANLTGTCQDECVEWHGELKDNFADAHDVHRLNATGADIALCGLLKQNGEMIKQQGC
jgi:hypothetical protein